MKIILTHDNADFDAVASLLAAHKLQPDAIPVLPARLNYNVNEFMSLYRNGLPYREQKSIDFKQVTSLHLVDTRQIPETLIDKDIPVHITDHHHPGKKQFGKNVTTHIERVGAATTMLVEELQKRGIALTSLEATLLALGIYEDTGRLTYSLTTSRDLQAASWLIEQQAALDTIRRFLSTTLYPEQLRVFERLMENAETRIINGRSVAICTATLDRHVNQLNSVAHALREELDASAVIALIQLPTYIQMICRSKRSSVDVGELARHFGGGGHERASSAPIKGKSATLADTKQQLWSVLPEYVHPITRVGDLMSQGVKTVPADERIEDIIGELRRVGHEGYPVIEDGRVVGLLSLRDADKALEHGLKRANIRDIMTGGEYTLTPEDSVTQLEQTIVASGWGQIPVVDTQGRLTGIVTRTDLIKHWVDVHPKTVVKQPRIDMDDLQRVLGEDVGQLMTTITEFAQKHQVHLYMVGGVVRDLVLQRANDDIDFVVERNGTFSGNAIDFAELLQAEFGGHVSSYRPFGTAKWRFDETISQELGIELGGLPNHIDFATSRNEFYERPTALPTVYAGSIKLDLHRRDFTINTLAIQLSPQATEGRILDFYGGLNDLENRVIRVLHSLSFVDDPTRVIRAVRFKHRLGFEIEARTGELIERSLNMLGRITGERIRNELTLLLREQTPENALADLEERGVLKAIHHAFVFDDRIANYFELARQTELDWLNHDFAIEDIYWHLLFAHVAPDKIVALGERLLLGKSTIGELVNIVDAMKPERALNQPEARISEIVHHLDGLHDITLFTLWIIGDELQRTRLQRYVTEWKSLQSYTTGHTLRAMDVPAGPAYRIILARLRDAWLDGELTTEEEENALLQQLIAEKVPDEDD